MSARAAWRLEAMGFVLVYDYVAGKADWGAAGLPREGTTAGEPTAGEVARTDVPTCRLDDDLAAVRQTVRATDWELCVVVNEAGVVLGRVGREALRSDQPGTVEEAMAEGPGTVRANAALASLVERLRRRGLSAVLVTRPDGTLVGAVRLDEAERLTGRADSTASRRAPSDRL
jgi:CBS domain-containing protein